MERTDEAALIVRARPVRIGSLRSGRIGSLRSGRIGSLIAVLAIGVAGIALLIYGKGLATKATPPPPREPATAAEWYARGDDLLKRARDVRGASEAYRRATELAPDLGVAHFGLGYALLELGDLEGAIAELGSALSLARANEAWKQDAENALVLAHLRKSAAEKR